MPKVSVTIKSGAKLRKTVEADSVQGLLKKLGLNREVYLTKCNGKFVPDGEPLGEGDQVELIKVVAGGS